MGVVGRRSTAQEKIQLNVPGLKIVLETLSAHVDLMMALVVNEGDRIFFRVGCVLEFLTW